ncbi:MAG: hypothetical protein ACXQS2_01135, partial [Methermicoccaceae archaeon]
MNESWGVGFYVTSSDGREYSGGVLYFLSGSDGSFSLSRLMVLTDITSNGFYYNLDRYPETSLSTSSSKLYLAVDTGGVNRDFLYQTSPLRYSFSASFRDKGEIIAFNLTLRSNKGVTLATTLGFVGVLHTHTYYYDHTNVDVEGSLTVGKEKLFV